MIPPPQLAPVAPIVDDLDDTPAAQPNSRARRRQRQAIQKREVPIPPTTNHIDPVPQPIAFHSYGTCNDLSFSSSMPNVGNDFLMQFPE